MNKVFWFDVPVHDIDRASDWYYEVFGWDIQPRHPKDGNDALSFRMAFTGETGDNWTPLRPGSVNGGVVTRDIGITQPTILIEVDSIDDKLKQLVNAGGGIVAEKVHLPLAAGYFAYVTDPDGNVLGLYEWEK
ncbi:VOC family protein [Streptomyces sp. 8N114]|uniref:VOC family protein n=1 Tax=Streptomyces sp. 8N114 TaxID=3457419 RepID=UPI003FD40007